MGNLGAEDEVVAPHVADPEEGSTKDEVAEPDDETELPVPHVDHGLAAEDDGLAAVARPEGGTEGARCKKKGERESGKRAI